MKTFEKAGYYPVLVNGKYTPVWGIVTDEISVNSRGYVSHDYKFVHEKGSISISQAHYKRVTETKEECERPCLVKNALLFSGRDPSGSVGPNKLAKCIVRYLEAEAERERNSEFYAIRKIADSAFASGYNRGCEETSELWNDFEGRSAYPTEYPLPNDGSCGDYVS